MPQRATSSTIVISGERAAEIDALAQATHRSREDVVEQALTQYFEAHSWQMERIVAGVDAARKGDVSPADTVFAKLADRHGWAL